MKKIWSRISWPWFRSPSVSAPGLLEIERGDRPYLAHRISKRRNVCRKRFDGTTLDRASRFGPVTVTQPIGRELEMHRYDATGRRDFEIRLLGNFPVFGGVIRPFEIFQARRHDERAFGQAMRAVRQHVDLGNGAAHADRLRVPDELRRQFRRADEVEQGVARVGARDHDAGADFFTAREPYARDALLVDQDARNAGRRTQLPAARLHRSNERIGNRPRAGSRRAVAQPAAIEPVVNQRVTGAGRHRAERRAVDRQPADGRLERLRLEPFFGEFDGGHRQAAHDAKHVPAAEPTQLQRKRRQRQAFRAPGDFRQARHRCCVRGVQEGCRRVHERDELGPASGVARRQSLDRVERGRVVGVGRQPQRASVWKHRPVQAGRRAARESVTLEIEVTHDIRPQMGARVQRRDVETGPIRQRRELSAWCLAPLEYEYVLAGLGEVSSRHETVVTRADDQDVWIGHGAATANPSALPLPRACRPHP